MSEDNHSITLENLHPPPGPRPIFSNITHSILLTNPSSNQQNSHIENHSNGICSLRDEMLAELERLRAIMRGDTAEYEKEYKNLADAEKKIVDRFLKFFETCPICTGQNHRRYLLEFYFNPDPDKIILRERLLKLMVESKEFDETYYNKVILGIPCCNCFKLFFEESIFI